MSNSATPTGDGNSAAPGAGRPRPGGRSAGRRSVPGSAGSILDVPHGPMAGTLHTLRLTRVRWDAVVEMNQNRAVATVVGAWLLLAWGRFGLQGLSAPRAGLRFLLVGVYGWLLLAASVYLIGGLAFRFGPGTPGSFGVRRTGSFGLRRTLQLTGLCHQPVVLVGFVVLFGSLLPIQGPLSVLAFAGIGLWMPAMLTVAVRSMMPNDRLVAIGGALAGYLIWAATAGRYLLDRVGHLV